MTEALSEPVITKVFRLHPKQQQAFKYLQDPSVHTVLFGGGVAGGKSRLIAAFILWSALSFAGTRYLIGRKTLSGLRVSTLVSLFDVASEMGIRDALQYNQQLNTITLPNESVILLRQLDPQPSDPTMVELGSTEFTAVAVDEVGEVEEIVYTTLLQRLRYKLKKNGITGKVLLCSNPSSNWTRRRIYTPWEQGTLSKVSPGVRYVHCLPTDNPFNEPSYLATLTPENLGEEEYLRKVLGNWNVEATDVQLYDERDIIDASTWDHFGVDQYERFLSIDVATSKGSDHSVVMLWQGLVLKECWKWKGLDTVALHQQVREIIREHRVPIGNVIVDAVGVGQGLADLLGGCVQFKGNNTRLNDEGFHSQRDQLYHKGAELLAHGKIRIQTRDIDRDGVKKEDIAQLTEELLAHKRYRMQREGLARVTPKELVVRAISRSPDLSDAFTMRLWFLYRRREFMVDVIRW